jgi:hypothetical protein
MGILDKFQKNKPKELEYLHIYRGDCKIHLIPNALNNFIFERAKAPKIDDRKAVCIALILTTLRLSICRQLSRCSNMKLFNAFGISN